MLAGDSRATVRGGTLAGVSGPGVMVCDQAALEVVGLSVTDAG